MLIEMHSHTLEHSACSHVSALELVRGIFAKGLQGLVFTDHHYLWPEEELAQLRRRAEIPDHFLVLAGQEVTTADFGDVLVYGAAETLAAGTPLKEIRRRFPRAALVWAHPYRKGRLPCPEDLAHPGLDAVEIFNSNQTARENTRALRDWHQERFTAIAGTDTHGPAYAGLYPTLFDHPVQDIGGLAGEIRAGRCRPFIKEIPKAGSKSLVTEVTIGAKGPDEIRERIIIRTLDSSYGWKSAARSHHILAALAEEGFAGGAFRVPLPIDEDPEARTVIQQGLRGKSLFDRLLGAPVADGRHYLQLTARWLARLHTRRLRLTPADEFLSRERRRLDRYVERFTAIGHPHARRAREIAELVWEAEEGIVRHRPDCLVQGHGDFHPKNIIIGQDHQEDRSTLFVGAVDFESSLCLPPAFDVGCFLAQTRNQLFGHPDILPSYPEEIFLDSYLEAATPADPDFRHQVELFRARTHLSIAAYLIKLGQGESGELWRVLVEAEQALSAGRGSPAPPPVKAPPARRRCLKGKDESERKPGAYRCAKCGAVSGYKEHVCKPRRLDGETEKEND